MTTAVKARAAFFVVSLLAIEGLCRAFFTLMPRRAYRDFGSDTWWRLRWARELTQNRPEASPYDRYLAYHPTRGWATRPGLAVFDIGMGARASTNSRGLRGNREYPPGCANARRRLLVLGDSFAFGEEVDDAQTFPARLESSMPGLEAVNLGTGGYGHDQMLLALREEGPYYCAQAVLLLYLQEDDGRNNLRFRDYAKPFFELRDEELILTGVPVPTPAQTALAHRFGSRALDLLRLLADRAFPERDRTPLLLDLIAREARRGGRKFGIVYTKDGRGEPGPLIEGFCAQRGLDCLSVDLRGIPRASGYTHWSPQMHAQVTRQLAPFIKKRLF